MSDLHNAKLIIESVLRKDPQSRNSDDYLFIKVCSIINPEFIKLPIEDALRLRSEMGIPSFETVRRTRQKAQAEHEELRACGVVQEYRKENEKAFYEFSING